MCVRDSTAGMNVYFSAFNGGLGSRKWKWFPFESIVKEDEHGKSLRPRGRGRAATWPWAGKSQARWKKVGIGRRTA